MNNFLLLKCLRSNLSKQEFRSSLSTFSKNILFLLTSFIFCSACIQAQSLTISNTGQTGTAGTNWSTSGTNPVTIAATGTANINTSVIVGYLNVGTSVIINNTAAGTAINSDILKSSGAAASLSFKDVAYFKVATNVSIKSTAAALNIVLWSDSDNNQGGGIDDWIFVNPGVSFESNGGSIVMAGGPDNGANGGVSGDGIPDGFTWNGSNNTGPGSDQLGGLTLGPRGGTGTVISLLSNGGNIILRGSTSNNNSYPGITSQANLKIDAGTGQIVIYGKSTTGHGLELTYGAAPDIAISSASPSSPAISIKGTAIAANHVGYWVSNNGSGNILIQSTATTGGGVSIEGTSVSDVGVRIGASASNMITQVLSQAGDINLSGLGASNASLQSYGEVYLGNRKDATAVQGITPVVTSSTANINFKANDQFSFGNTSGKNTNINSTGVLSIEAYSPGYTGTLSWTGNVAFGSAFSSITLGESAETYHVTLNNSLSSAGNITAYANNFTLNNGIGLASTGAGNISINAKANFTSSGTTRRTISTVNGNINIYADADANGSGELAIGYVTFNPGTGNTIVRCETTNWSTSTNVEKPYFNGTGEVTIEPSDASFQNINTDWFYFDQDANGMSGLTIGKSSNLGTITHATNAILVGGAIYLGGGVVTLDANLTSSATGDIFIKSNNNLSPGYSIEGNAAILKTGGTGTLTMQSGDRIKSGTITASGTGVLNVVLWSDYDNENHAGVEVYNITTNGGHLWVGGSNTNGGSYTWKGLVVGDGPSVGSSANNHNAVDFYGPVTTSGGSVLIWGGDGYAGGAYGIAFETSPTVINSGAGDIVLIADVFAANNASITCTGKLNLLPNGGSYPAAIAWSGTVTGGNFDGTTGTAFDKLVINNIASLGGLTIGYYNGQLLSGVPQVQSNTSDITISSAISVAGPITLYSTNNTVNENLASSASGNISLHGNTLSVGSGKTLTSSGRLIIEPITAATTIGVAGGAGTLAITSTNLSSNFTNGFSEISIGNSTAGNITVGTTGATALDNFRLITSGNMNLDGTIQLDNNNLRFLGTNIIPATGKFVKTNGVGKLIADISAAGSKLFPVGVNNYNPVTISNHIGVADTFYVTVSSGIYWDGTTGGTAVPWSPRVDITWNVSNVLGSTGAGNIDMLYGWTAAEEVEAWGVPKLTHFNGTSWEFASGTTAYDLGARTVTQTAYAGLLSPFSITDVNMVLPVNWISFAGKRVGNTVHLDWVTAFEQNNNYFDIERSLGNNSFYNIGRVSAIQNQVAGGKYNFIDQQPLNGNANYRLKQIDLDGKSSYSKIISVNFRNDDNYKVTAIPGSKQLVLSIPGTGSAKTHLIVYDAVGRQVLRQQVLPGRTIIQTGFLMANGIYNVNIVENNTLLFSSRFIQ